MTDKNHPDETVLTIVQGKGTLPREQAGRNIHYDDASLSNYKMVQKGDFIIHLRSFEGGLEMANENGIVSPAYTILRGKKPHSSRFYEAYFHTDEFVNHVLSKSVEGIRDGRQISYDAFKWLGLPYCSPSEQAKIAELFSVLTKRIEKQTVLVDSLKKYKRGVTAKLIAAIEEKYPVVRLGDHVTVMRGGSPRPIDAYITNAENGIRWIKIGDALPDQLYISDTKEKIKPEGAKKSRRVYAGDLILSNSMSFGRPYILKVDGCIHDGWLLIRDEEKKFDKRFLCFYLASDVTLAQYKKYAAGSCVNNLNSELVASVEIGMPPIEQQIRMANILEKIDRQVEAASTMYLLLSKLRSSLLQQLFI